MKHTSRSTWLLLLLLLLLLLPSLCLNSRVVAQATETPDVSEPARSPSEPLPEAPAADETEAPAPSEQALEGEGEVVTPAETAAIALPKPEGDDIVVTGTRIRTAFSRAAPVDVVDRKQLARSGASNLADTVQYLSAAQGTGIQGGAGLGAANSTASQINLRGLGVGTTLLLINGRRVNPTAYGTVGIFSDLSLVPMAAVERIEILKSGASAIYGADAVGGVVNIITRRNWSGSMIQLDGKSTQRFDLNEYTASAGIGARADGARVMAAFSYFRRGELTADERDWPSDKYLRTGGYPGAFGAGMALMPDPACGTDAAPGSSALPTGACQTSYRPYASLVSSAERANAFGSAEYDLTDAMTLFGEILVSRFRGDNTTPNPGSSAPLLTVPADHVDNPFGRAVSFAGSPGGGSRQVTASDDTFRGVVGLKGEFGALSEDPFWDSWSWELSTTLGISRFMRTIDDNLRTPLQAALDSCSDPADLGNCFNPFYSAVTGSGTPNSAAVVDLIQGREIEIADHALQMYNAGVTGALLELPGGEMGFALGGELRREWRVVDVDHTQNRGEYLYLGATSDWTVDRSVYSGYLELLLPLYHGIELQAAGRIEKYTDMESSAISPFGGVSLSLAEIAGPERVPSWLRGLYLRANLSRPFRAPGITQTYPGLVGIVTSLRYQDRQEFILVNYKGNPALKPQTALAWSAGLTWSPIEPLTLSADYWWYDFRDRIQPENPQKLLTDWVALGMPADPKVGFDVGSGLVGPIIAQNVNVPGSIMTSGLDFSLLLRLGAARRNDAERGESADAGVQASVGASGTLTFSYEVPQSQATNAKNCTGTGEQARCDVVGGRNALPAGDPPSLPRLKLNIPASIGIGGHSLTATGHYFSSLEDDVLPAAGAPDDGNHIAAWFSLDVQYGYTLRNVIGKELALRVGCENVLDKQPAIVNSTDPPYASEVHDPRGRVFYARASAEF